VFPVANATHTQEPWYHAIQRCLDECNNLAESIRRLSEDSLENNSPHFVCCIFIAARFLLGKFTPLYPATIFGELTNYTQYTVEPSKRTFRDVLIYYYMALTSVQRGGTSRVR
jgi:hypothetical protein